ncbi:hypothetical protein AKN87_07195 [Thiopseudomonas alkaliphila]|uniref:TIGR03747 family integrating conjugative element membrane protein n=1 Tax=Thiopseudomonas alkaliphila TaxID=1697053 RepID=UPI00069DF87B|nr:TIGR03747 family integrating conjugative element membrane protein [Thiopseudomonas alkaliphila]AKX44903.1 hypothetical protein AKN87_07195 [Thiopseudomonas alkaliphila]AKX57712.1 hypothetical protein AKN89_07755 [Thiopseudomonas alkaliphila]
MAEQRPQQQKPQEPKTFIGKTWAMMWKVIGLLLISLLVSLLIEYVGITFWWPDEGWQHSRNMLDKELGWLDDGFRRSLILSAPGSSINQLLNISYDWIFVKTGLAGLSQNASAMVAAKGTTGWLATAYLMAENYILATLFVTMTFIVRLSILVLSIPLFMLSIMTAVVDGLMRRDIRKFGAGRESSFIYHRAKMMIVPLIFAPWVLYLAAPISIHPQLILIPCAISLGVAIVITIATFKKYL